MNQQINFNEIIKVPEEGLACFDDIEKQIPRNYPIKDKIKRVLIPIECIKKRMTALARQMVSEYKNAKQLYIIPILKGAFVFAADLGREIVRLGGPELKIDFYEAETYGLEIKKKGEKERKVRIIRRPRTIKGIDVLLVDDIGDTLRTLNVIKEDLINTLHIEPQKIKICFLLDKILKNPSKEVRKLKERLKPDYVGFEIPDMWIAGYGIDAGEDFRLLSSVVAVKEELY